MKKDKSLKVKRIEEIEYIYNLLQRTLEKEGYELPQFTHADRGYKSFPIELKNEIVKEDKMTIKIEFEVHD